MGILLITLRGRFMPALILDDNEKLKTQQIIYIMIERIKFTAKKYFKSKLSHIILVILILNVVFTSGYIFYKFFYTNEYGFNDYAKLLLSGILLLLYFYTFIKNKD